LQSYTKGTPTFYSFTQFLLMGDFNYPEIDWSSLTASGGDSTPAATFLNTCEDTFLIQHVQNPTRSRGNQHPPLLDLVLLHILKL